MENVRLYSDQEHGCHPHQQYDALVRRLGYSGSRDARVRWVLHASRSLWGEERKGRREKSTAFYTRRLYAYTSDQHIRPGKDYTYSERVITHVRRYHEHVNITVALGSFEDKLSTVDAHMKADIQCFMRDSDRGDVLVIITGDVDFRDVLRHVCAGSLSRLVRASPAPRAPTLC